MPRRLKITVELPNQFVDEYILSRGDRLGSTNQFIKGALLDGSEIVRSAILQNIEIPRYNIKRSEFRRYTLSVNNETYLAYRNRADILGISAGQLASYAIIALIGPDYLKTLSSVDPNDPWPWPRPK